MSDVLYLYDTYIRLSALRNDLDDYIMSKWKPLLASWVQLVGVGVFCLAFISYFIFDNTEYDLSLTNAILATLMTDRQQYHSAVVWVVQRSVPKYAVLCVTHAKSCDIKQLSALLYSYS